MSILYIYLSISLSLKLSFVLIIFMSLDLSQSLSLSSNEYIYYDIYNVFHTQCIIQPYFVCLKSNRLCIMTDFPLLQFTVFIAYFFNETKSTLHLKIVVNFLYLLNSNNSYCYFCVVYGTRLRFMSFTKIAFKLFTLVNVRPNALLDY